MPITSNAINQAYNHLMLAERLHQSVSPITKLLPALTIDEAYQTQLKVIDYKVNHGAKILGKKNRVNFVGDAATIGSR